MKNGKLIVISGPAGSGKGTVTKKIAQEMGLTNIDTGATYRCVALAALENGIPLEEKEKIIEISKNITIDMDTEQNVFLNGKNVTKSGAGNSAAPLMLFRTGLPGHAWQGSFRTLRRLP